MIHLFTETGIQAVQLSLKGSAVLVHAGAIREQGRQGTLSLAVKTAVLGLRGGAIRQLLPIGGYPLIIGK